MKTLLTTLLISTTFIGMSYGEEIHIPKSNINLFVGSFSQLEKELKDKIFDIAIEKCGTLENVSIGKAEITLNLSNIYNFSVQGREDVIEGSYPQVGAKVNINCHR
ncbi:hypothetical protein M899_2888 [Bacteriovorax sp. BSW11_IV]|uniref:hypothetical protein n=1 Tax=Bacteriovorax sp. BSW11_IV TaxID=1353529 RepID=UPI000389DDF5|nr:hypothetical protein [Bacteriovorax sp. BSW11_IV]EQC50172.1 hypothetical protein M899_2888 [Bacteriovorax sp. BSW11_IV]